MESIFITGTGTDVGKTVVTAAIIKGLVKSGLKVAYIKPIQTGGVDVDATLIRKHGGEGFQIFPSLYTYHLPLSPDQAAQRQNKPYPLLGEISKKIDQIKSENYDFLLIEGAGGLYVPLNDQGHTWMDFMATDSSHIVCVSKDYLGTLNHTVMTVECLEKFHSRFLGVVFTDAQKDSQNLSSLKVLIKSSPIIPFQKLEELSKNVNWESASLDLSNAVLKQIEFQKDKTEKYSGDNETLEADKKYVWHPYTQHQLNETPLVIKGAKGIYLELDNGKKLIDGCSSWWVNTLGHGQEDINKSLREQHSKMDHVIFAGVTHKPAALLAQNLVHLSKGSLDRVFYSDNGSTAIEVALKIAFQSFVNKGETNRTKFLGFRGSYHGDTFGAMSVAKSDGFHGVYKPLMFETLWANPLTSHQSYVCPEGMSALETNLAEITDLLEKHHNSLAGVIIEPLIQGAGGMLMQPEEWLQKLSGLCKKYHLPLILDEVFTGMGRVGEMFAFQRSGIDPDIVCLAKGLTGGALPLAVTMAKEQFFNSFLDDDKSKALLHGHSFTANPTTCQTALTALAVLKRDQILDHVKQIEIRFSEWIEHEGSALGVENPRCKGAVLAFELPGSGFNDYFDPRASLVPKEGRRHGLFLRTLGNTIYFVPPLVISKYELDIALDSLSKTLKVL